jgi:hypothetical protein
MRGTETDLTKLRKLLAVAGSAAELMRLTRLLPKRRRGRPAGTTQFDEGFDCTLLALSNLYFFEHPGTSVKAAIGAIVDERWRAIAEPDRERLLGKSPNAATLRLFGLLRPEKLDGKKYLSLYAELFPFSRHVEMRVRKNPDFK